MPPQRPSIGTLRPKSSRSQRSPRATSSSRRYRGERRGSTDMGDSPPLVWRARRAHHSPTPATIPYVPAIHAELMAQHRFQIGRSAVIDTMVSHPGHTILAELIARKRKNATTSNGSHLRSVRKAGRSISLRSVLPNPRSG